MTPSPLQVLSVSVLPFLLLVYSAVSQIVAKKLRASLTVLNELPLLSNSRNDEEKIPGTAVICGGSIAGLVAARVCSNHFTKVLIIEPEEWVTTKNALQHHRHGKSDSPPKRSHVAQYNAFHASHGILTLVFARLFPEVEREFEKEGARIAPLETKMFVAGVPMLPLSQYPRTIYATRPVIETTLRRMVMTNCSNVMYHPGSVTGFLRGEGSSNQLAGVKVRSRDGDEQHISASLVVDCTGPACGGLRWLKDLPFDPIVSSLPAPSTSLPLQDLKLTYDHKMSYTTCEFLVPLSLNESLNCLGFPTNYETAAHVYLYIPNSKVERTHLIIQRRENNSLQLACGGWDLRARITSVAGIRSYLSEMVPMQPLPNWLFAMLDLFEREEVPTNYHFCRCPPSVYIQYHRAHNLPSNFVAIGDSVLQSNPVAAEGMAKAGVETVTLNTMLAQCVPSSSTKSENTLPSNFGKEFFAIQARRTGHVWDSVKTTDYAFKTTIPAAGDNRETTNAWKRWYVTGVLRLSTKDKYVTAVLFQVINWLAPATDLFSPVIIRKVLWLKFRDYVGI